MPHAERPGPDEYAPFYAGYVARVPDGDIGRFLDEQSQEPLFTRLAELDDERARFRYAPGKWSVKEVVQHLTDVERIQTYRALCIARGDQTPLPGFEEDDYAAASDADRRTPGALVHEWDVVRAGTTELVAGLTPEALARRGTANGRTLTARALVWIIAGHTDHHLAILRDRYTLG